MGLTFFCFDVRAINEFFAINVFTEFQVKQKKRSAIQPLMIPSTDVLNPA